MKYILPFLLLLPVWASAQTDSTAIKLKHYKSLYEQGLIDSNEYKSLKASALNISNVRPPQTKAEVFKSGRNLMIAGGVFFGAGMAQVSYGIYYRAKFKPSTKSTTYADDLYSYNMRQGLLFGVGVPMSVAGMILMAVGSSKLEKSKAMANIQFRPDGICLNF